MFWGGEEDLGLHHYNGVREGWAEGLKCSVIFVVSFELMGEGASKNTEIWTDSKTAIQTCSNHVIPTSSGSVPFSVY